MREKERRERLTKSIYSSQLEILRAKTDPPLVSAGYWYISE